MTARLLALIGLLVALAGAAIWFYRQGGQSVAISIERQNNEAGDAADKARSDYDRCIDGGGVYDFETGQCHKPAPRRRN